MQTMRIQKRGEAPRASDVSAEMLFDLGMRYCTGKGVPLDMAEAHKWFNLASLRGHAKARQYRQELARELSDEELREALARARRWLER